MAALTHFAKIDATQRTTTATSANEVTQYTVAWADLTGAGFSAGDDVLLIHQTSLGGDNVDTLVVYNIKAGTTFAGAANIDDGHVDQQPVAVGTSASHNVFWIERHTLVVDQNFYFDLSGSAAGTVRSDDFSFIVLRLNDLTENVDYKWNQVDHGVVDAPTTYGTTGASVTIPSASQDWLALAQVRWLDDSVTADMFTALSVDGVDRMELRNEGESTSGDYLIGIIDALVAPADGATVQVRFRTDTASTHDAFTSKVFILRLGVFEDYELAHSTSTVTHTTVDSLLSFITFPTFPLTTTGDMGFFAQSRHVYSEVTKGAYGQLQDNAVEIVSGYRRATAMGNGTTDQVAVTFAVVAARTAGTLPIGFLIAEDFDITPNYSATEHSAVVFSFELADVAVTGTIAVTQDDQTAAFTGTVANPITGSIGVTQADQTAAFVGTETISGTIGVTQQDQTGAFSGTVAGADWDCADWNPDDWATDCAPTGTIGVIQDDQTAAFVGTVTGSITGTIGVTQDDQTAAFVGNVAGAVTGTIGVTQDNQTAAFAGDTVQDGIISSIQQNQTAVFNGTVANPITGTISVTQQDQIGAFTGFSAVSVVGTIAVTQADQTMSASATVVNPVSGTIAVTQQNQTAVFAGLVANPPEGAIVAVSCSIGGPTVSCTILPDMIVVGSNVVVTATFTDDNGDLADPISVSAIGERPDGTQITPTPTSIATGIWKTTFPTDGAGYWFYQITGEGDDIDVVCSGSFCVVAGLVLV